MTTSRPPDQDNRLDDLKQRYLKASAEQNIGPSERVRQAALAHAQMVAATAAPVLGTQARPAAANRWNFSLVASVAIAGISALLALQFDRSDSQDKEVVLGTPSVTAPPVSAQPPATQLPELAAKKSAAEPMAEPSAPSAAQSATRSTAERATKSPAESTLKSPALTTARPTANTQAPKSKAPPDAKEPTTEALSLPAPAPAPLMKDESATQSEKASAERSARSAPPAAQSKPAPAADAEFSTPAPPKAQSAEPGAQSRAQSEVQPSAPMATMRSRPAAPPAAAPTAPALPGNALRSVAQSGQIGMLEQALQQATAAQINAPDDKGRTPLMLATLGGHIGAVQRLLTAGADASLKDSQGNTAVQMARQLDFTVIENLLKKQPVAQ